jgi:predicted RNase H-related nuclease YkuK (DUF458 family)
MDFRTISNQRVNPITYTAKIIQSDPFVETHIGTDSQRVGSYINYVTAIAYRYPMKGVHYIYCKHTFPPNKDNWSRLWFETERTMGIAERLSQNLPGIRFEIDMDYNDNKGYMSHKLVSSAKGWAESLGYKVNIKPNKQIATRAADHHCR